MSEIAEPLVDQIAEKRIAKFIEIRDTLKAMDEAHEKAKEPFIEVRDWLTGWMQTFLDKTGAESVKTAAGTCYSTTRYSASLADPQAFMNFVIAHDKWDLLDRKANAPAVRDYVAEIGTLPPGVNLSALKTVGVRRK
jgi:hypothetical protein